MKSVWILRRLAQMAALLVLLSGGLFYLVHRMPGSPEEMLLGTNPELSAHEVARLRALRGLDRPIPERYVCWMLGRRGPGCDAWPTKVGVLGGEWGWSRVHRKPVWSLVGERLPYTLSLMLPALVGALLLAVPFGIVSAVRAGTPVDLGVRAIAFVGLSVPAHWLGLMAILVFAVGLGWLPAGGVADLDGGGALRHAVLPVVVLGTYYVGRWTRYVRVAVLEQLEQPYLDAARARGLDERAVILRHALPNALLPLVTVVGQSLPVSFSGALVVERVFAYPGMGLLIYDSVVEHDHLVAVTLFLVYAAITFLAALLADVAYTLLDPRIRWGAQEAA